MGLDMFLYRTKKVDGLEVEDYEKVDIAVSNINDVKEFVNIEKAIEPDEFNPAYNELNECVKQRGKSFSWLSIFEDIGYWRKANQIHNFFVQECQDGIDECQYSMVSKEALEDLLERCKRAMKLKKVYLNDGIIKDGEGLETFLPTSSGFFFGGTEFNEWYFEDVAETKKLITKVLKDTDFDTQIILYRASW
jgi:hypothetical protein